MLDYFADFSEKLIVSHISSEQMRIAQVQVVRCESLKQVGEIFFAQNLPFDGFVASVVGQLHRVYCVNIEV